MNPCVSCGSERNAKPRADCMAVSSHTITRYTQDGTPVPVPGTHADSPLGYYAECMGIPHADHLTTWAGTPGWPRPICGSVKTHERHRTPIADSPPVYSAGYDRWLERHQMDSVSEILNGMIRYGAERTDSPLTLLKKLIDAGWRYMPHCGEGCTGSDCTFCHENEKQAIERAKTELCYCHKQYPHIDPVSGTAKNGTVPHDGQSHELALEMKRLADSGVTICTCIPGSVHQYGSGACTAAG